MLRRIEPARRPRRSVVRVAAAVAAIVLLLAAALAAVLHQRGEPSPPSRLTPVEAPRSSTGPATRGRVTAAEATAREALANRPLPQLPQDDGRPMPISTRDPGPPISLPPAQSIGAAGVPTGFPHTAAGAMAQMIAIDQTAMQSGQLPGVRAVIRAWAVSGGPTPSSWSAVAAMAGLLSDAGLSGNGSPSLSIVVTPAMGLIKGSVGSDFVVPCVDFEFDVTLNQTARAAAADCERMVWTGDSPAHGGHWLIGPGPEPAPGTSVWPDTDEAIAAGYRDLETSTATAPGGDR